VPEHANAERTPHYVAWLRRIYARPPTLRLFETSRSLGRMALGVAAEIETAEAA
jgi:hypothetical protein